MVRSQHLKDTTTQHITTHMHGYKKNKKKVYHLITACMCVGIYRSDNKNTEILEKEFFSLFECFRQKIGLRFCKHSCIGFPQEP